MNFEKQKMQLLLKSMLLGYPTVMVQSMYMLYMQTHYPETSHSGTSGGTYVRTEICPLFNRASAPPGPLPKKGQKT